jgi:hypothetical protein
MELPSSELRAVQEMLYGLIRSRMIEFGVDMQLPLPELASLPDSEEEYWFAVPGMAGGFNIKLNKHEGTGVSVVTESWSRINGGSGQRHRITSSQIILEEEGFV